MNIILTIVTIITPLFAGIWVLADKNYNYFNDKFYTFLYCFSALWLVPLIWNIIVSVFIKISESKVDVDCFIIIEKNFNELKTTMQVDIILSSISILGVLFLIIVIKALSPNK